MTAGDSISTPLPSEPPATPTSGCRRCDNDETRFYDLNAPDPKLRCFHVVKSGIQYCIEYCTNSEVLRLAAPSEAAPPKCVECEKGNAPNKHGLHDMGDFFQGCPVAAAPQDDPIEKMLDECESAAMQKWVSKEKCEPPRVTEHCERTHTEKRQAIRDYVSRLRAERDEARLNLGELYERLSTELSKLKETALTREEAGVIISSANTCVLIHADQRSARERAIEKMRLAPKAEGGAEGWEHYDDSKP